MSRMQRKWKLHDISEQKVLKVAIEHLHRRLTADAGVEAVQELPRRKDGTLAVMQGSFFRRLLTEELELKGAAQSDVSAAQSDLRYLSCQQLLAIRSRTLDFVTVSSSHSAHNNFLTSVDGHLLEHMARRGLTAGGVVLHAGRQRPEVLRCVGLKLLLVIGAAEVLKAEMTSQEVTLPACWAIRLEGEAWEGCPAAILRIPDLSIHLLQASGPDYSCVPPGERVAVTSDRVSGDQQNRRLHWEIVSLDITKDDVLTEMSLKSDQVEARKNLALELVGAMKERFQRRQTSLGLKPSREELEAAAAAQQPAERDFMRTPQKGMVSQAVRSFEQMTPSPPVQTLFPNQSFPSGASKWSQRQKDKKLLQSEQHGQDDPAQHEADLQQDDVELDKQPDVTALAAVTGAGVATMAGLDEESSSQESTTEPEDTLETAENSPTDQELKQLAGVFDQKAPDAETSGERERDAYCGLPCVGSRDQTSCFAGVARLLQGARH